MKFYDCATAPSPRRARMFIAEKGLNIERIDISIARGEQLTPEFLAINPAGTLPALITEAGAVLSENIAIAVYLETLAPNPPLMGQTAEEKAQILQWNAICEQHGGMAVAEVLRNSHPAMENRALPGPQNLAQIPALAERGHLRLDAFFERLNTRLAQTAFLAGDAFSMADITGFVMVDFARVIKRRIPQEHSQSQRWFDAIAARPSAQI